MDLRRVRPMPETSANIPAPAHGTGRIEQLEAELRQARERLQECRASFARSHSALCAIADGIVVVDTAGHVTTLNPVATHLTGYTEAEALGRPLSEVVRFTDAAGRAMDVLSEGFQADPRDIVSLVRRDRHVILVDGSVAPIHDDGKRPVGSIVTFRNVTAAVRLTRELSHHAHHDPLTGLENRRAFAMRLQRAIGSAAEFGACHAILYFDLDRFKAVNDSAGHVAGDEMLRQLAIVLRRQLRANDTLARLGGDEFAVLVENCSAATAAGVAEKIRAAIAGFEFEWDGCSHRIGCSIGQVVFDDGRLAPDRLIELADRECYAAKASGGNRVEAAAAGKPRSRSRTPRAASFGR
jgi:diguanylate cyclase (GGDEF)-like protein/PAS domain S-box-containing protein